MLLPCDLVSGYYEWIIPARWHGSGSDWPPARSNHSATATADDRIVVFGGLHSSSPFKVLNDMWILDTPTMKWTRVSGTKRVADAMKKQTGISLRQSKATKENFHERIRNLMTSMDSGIESPGIETYIDFPAPRSGHS